MNTKAMHVLIVFMKEGFIVVLIATVASIVTSMASLVESISSPEVLSAVVSGGLTLAVQFLRLWLRARERRKSEAQAWRDELARLNKQIAELKGERDE